MQFLVKTNQKKIKYFFLNLRQYLTIVQVATSLFSIHKSSYKFKFQIQKSNMLKTLRRTKIHKIQKKHYCVMS